MRGWRRLSSRARQGVAARAKAGEDVTISEIDERLAALRVELTKMDRRTRELIELRYRAGMTLGAIGRLVGLKPGAVDGRIRRAESAVGTTIEEAADDV